MGFYKSFRIANILTNLFSSKNLAKIVLFGVILLIIGFLFSNNVLAYSYDAPYTQVLHLGFGNDGKIIEQASGNFFVVHTETDKIYSIKNLSHDGPVTIRMTTEYPNIGVSYLVVSTINQGESYDFVGNDNYYCEIFNPQNGEVSMTYNYVNGYNDTISNMTETFSVQSLWTQFGFVIPLIGVAVLFAIGYLVVRKLSKGTSKGKVKF